ncbi:MAG TPA: hypothetical protein VKB75_04810, partial [Jatrophihabitans sp.]|nr:hypothetical protein [Jatrophihabitans sp.]
MSEHRTQPDDETTTFAAVADEGDAFDPAADSASEPGNDEAAVGDEDEAPVGRPISFDPLTETQVMMQPVMMQPVAPAPAPTVTAQVLPPALPETVTCPECGTLGSVVLSRRDSADFCTNCDFPLFWTPSKIQLDRASISDDSLRRLPGA